MKTSDNVRYGIFFAISAIFCFAIMNVAFKWYISLGYLVFEIIFFRTLFSFFPIMLTVYRAGGLKTLKTRRPTLHFVRSSCAYLAIAFFVLTVKYAPLVDALALFAMAPLMVAALSGPFLKESVGFHKWLAIIIGFSGGLIIIQPHFHTLNFASLFGVLCAVFLALNILFTRRLGVTDSAPSITFWGACFTLIVSALLLSIGWKTPSWSDLGGMVVMGLFGGLGQLLIYQALRMAPPATIAPYEYTSLIWGGVFGYLIWSDIPSKNVVIGALIIVTTGLYVYWRESQKKLQS